MEIELLSETFIKPNQEVEAANIPHYLTANELFPLSLEPMKRGLLYSLQNSPFTNKNDTVSHLLHNLKHSLAIALVHFYPLAGRFSTQTYPTESASSILLDCTKGPGARFIHASALDFSISDIISPVDVPKIVESFFELGEKFLCYDGHTRALLSIQVTELRDGVFIGFSMNHSLADGTSLIQFINTLHEIFTFYERNGGSDSDSGTVEISSKPIFFYNPMNVNGDIHAVHKLPGLNPDKLVPRDRDPGLLRERVFNFSPQSMASLKAKANQECGTHNVISSFKALIALVWRSITRARNQKPDQETACALLIDARSRFDPPVSHNYFGNLLSVGKVTCTVEELMCHDLGWAAMCLDKAIKAQDAKAIYGFLKVISEKPMVLQHNKSEFSDVIVGGISWFDMYEIEFGLGRPVAVRLGYANKGDAKVTGLSVGYQGKGSVELEICLRPHVMLALENDQEFMSFVS